MKKVHGFAAAALCSIFWASALAAQEMPPLSAYGALPAVEDVAISPSGESLAMVSTIRGRRMLLLLDAAQQVVRTVAANGIKFRGMNFIGDEALLFYRSETVEVMGFVADQYELQQALLVPFNRDGPISIVFAGNRRMSNAVFGTHGIRRTPQGWRGYFGAIEYERGSGGDYHFNNGHPALYEVDLPSMESRRAARSPSEGSYRDWLVNRDGAVAATFTMSRSTGAWTISNAAGLEIANGVIPTGDASLVGFGRDSSTILYSTLNPQSGLTDWFQVSLAGGAPVPFLSDVDVERFYWNRDSGELLGYLPDSENAEPVFYDPELQRRARMVRAAFAGREAQMVEWSTGLGRVLVHTEGNEDSGTWFTVDLATRRADPIGNDRPLIEPEHVGPISRVSYTAADGLELDGILTLPPGREPQGLPVVVMPHGGPHSHDEPGFDWWAQAFASRGYAVFQPNFRGSTGRGENFERAGYGEWGRKMQTDISDGLAHLVALGMVDPARACIVGASYGGYAALAGVTVQNGLYRCAVSVAGIADIGLMFSTENRESGSRLFRRTLQEELGPREGWADISPRRLAARADAPVLLIHGRDDTVVAFQQSRVMADALSDAGKPHRLVELEGEDHWLSLTETRQQMLEEAVAFVQEHNPGD